MHQAEQLLDDENSDGHAVKVWNPQEMKQSSLLHTAQPFSWF